jgi:hypothetical protein
VEGGGRCPAGGLRRHLDPAEMTRFELTRLPLVKPLLRSRWPQFLLTLVALGGFRWPSGRFSGRRGQPATLASSSCGSPGGRC